MKRSKSLFIACAAAGIFIASCAKEGLENTMPGNTSSNGALNNFIQQNAPPVQTFTFNAATGGVFTGMHGTELFVPANAFLYPNNQPVTGTVTLNLQEVVTKKDALMSGAFTISGDQPLVSGGEINVTAYQGALELHLAASNSIQVQMRDRGNSSGNMYEFRAPDFANTNSFIPINMQQPAGFIIDSSGYDMFTFALDSLDWTNIDQFWSNDPMTPVSCPVPQIFNNTNCVVFITHDTKLFASGLKGFDIGANAFSTYAHYKLPIGQQFRFTAIGEINGVFYYDSEVVTITENISVSLVPQITPQNIIVQNMDNL